MMPPWILWGLLVALVVTTTQYDSTTLISRGTGALALIVGAITLSGSMVAAGKLAHCIRQTPVRLKHHGTITAVLDGGILTLLLAVTMGMAHKPMPLSLVLLAGSLGLGALVTIRIGGADMPITISLLNSLSGLAAAIAGLAIANLFLVAIGAIVGAGGMILTGIMRRAMNRPLGHILTGARPASPARPNDAASPSEDIAACSSVSTPPIQPSAKQTPAELLREAKHIVIVPGYGMALAHAQKPVGQLCERLQALGKLVQLQKQLS